MIQKLDTATIETQLAHYGGSPVLVTLPPGHKAKLFVPSHLASAKRTVQAIVVEDIGALTTYLECQVTSPPNLAVFIDSKTRKITAVIDYAADHAQPGHNQHTVTLPLLFSVEFAALFDVLQKPLSQEAFLNFLDDWGALFQECSVLKETVADFRQHQITKVSKMINPRTGAGKLVVTTEDSVSEEINLPPEEIVAVVSLFPDQPKIELPVRIRPRPGNGAVTFTLLVPGLEVLIRKELLKIENRLEVWANELHTKEPAKNWCQVLRVRAVTPVLTQPERAQVIDLEGHALPENLKLGSAWEVPACTDTEEVEA